MIWLKQNYIFKKSYMGDLSENNLRWSCNCTGNWLGKGSHSECNYFMRDAHKSPRSANRMAVAYLSFCSSCSFSLPSMKVVDSADSGQNSEEQKWGRNALILFIGDLTLFIVFCHFSHFVPWLLSFPPKCLKRTYITFHAPVLSLTLW